MKNKTTAPPSQADVEEVEALLLNLQRRHHRQNREAMEAIRGKGSIVHAPQRGLGEKGTVR